VVDIARHVVQRCLTSRLLSEMATHDVASNIRQAIGAGVDVRRHTARPAARTGRPFRHASGSHATRESRQGWAVQIDPSFTPSFPQVDPHSSLLGFSA